MPLTHSRRLFLPLLVVIAVATSATDVRANVTRAQVVSTPAALLVPLILEKLPHDTSSFTEGLELHGGYLYESAGLEGQSSLRQENPRTGQPLRLAALDSQYFGEGITIVGSRIYQLTWQSYIGFVYDLATLQPIGQFSYDGEGWGLCYDGQQLYMSNGTATIAVRDPATFAITRQFMVYLDGASITMLNELECVGDSVYANVWQTNRIVQIDKATGSVRARIEVPDLLTAAEHDAAGGGGVLNGIAYDAGTNTFLITGKNWPWMFRVRFVPATYF